MLTHVFPPHASPLAARGLRTLCVGVVGVRAVVALVCDVAMPLVVHSWRSQSEAAIELRGPLWASWLQIPPKLWRRLDSPAAIAVARAQLSAGTSRRRPRTHGFTGRASGGPLFAHTVLVLSCSKHVPAARDCPSASPRRQVLSELLCRRRPRRLLRAPSLAQGALRSSLWNSERVCPLSSVPVPH